LNVFCQSRYIERFSLRTLVLHVKGATLFINLRTYDGLVHSSLRESTVVKGLAAHDDE